MSDEPDSLTLRLLRRIDANVSELRKDMREMLRRPTSAELLAQCDPNAPLPADPDWTSGLVVGDELI